MKERLIELMQDWGNENTDSFPFESLADYLLANGVMVVDGSVGVTNLKPLQTMCGMPLDEVAELITAKEEDRLIVPPCKVWDIIYVVEDLGYKKVLQTKEVGVIVIKGTNDFSKELWEDVYGGVIGSFADFGKTVFLTKEEAEQALSKLPASYRPVRKEDEGK